MSHWLLTGSASTSIAGSKMAPASISLSSTHKPLGKKHRVQSDMWKHAMIFLFHVDWKEGFAYQPPRDNEAIIIFLRLTCILTTVLAECRGKPFQKSSSGSPVQHAYFCWLHASPSHIYLIGPAPNQNLEWLKINQSEYCWFKKCWLVEIILQAAFGSRQSGFAGCAYSRFKM